MGRDNFGFQEKKKSKHKNIEKKKADGCQRDQVVLQEETIKGENANAKHFQYSISLVKGKVLVHASTSTSFKICQLY